MNHSVSLAEYINDWMDTYKRTTVKQSTFDRLQTSVTALEGHSIASMAIGEITSIHIQRYVNELTERGYALTTIKKQMRIVTAPLKQAAALHIIPANPAIGIVLPSRCNVRKESKAAEAYTPQEQDALIAILDTHERKAYDIIALMLETGLRAGEALALRWMDVQIERKRLTVRATVVRLANKKQSFVQDSAKSESSRRAIPLSPRAVEILSRLFENRKSEWVFEDGGERLSYEALRWGTKKACEASNIEYRGEHVFRHTFATNCYHKGIDVKILSRLLGHADVNITYNIYVHLYGDGFDELYSALVE